MYHFFIRLTSLDYRSFHAVLLSIGADHYIEIVKHVVHLHHKYRENCRKELCYKSSASNAFRTWSDAWMWMCDSKVYQEVFRQAESFHIVLHFCFRYSCLCGFTSKCNNAYVYYSSNFSILRCSSPFFYRSLKLPNGLPPCPLSAYVHGAYVVVSGGKES